MRIVHDHVGAHAERNFFLDLVVGLASAARRIETLTEHARTASARGDGGSNAHESDGLRAPSAETFEYFVLGVISFSRRLLAQVNAAKIDPPAMELPREESVRDLLL